ncbi:hypothetical protein ACFO3D_07515 [Virgibacillus kekensis]|uniref:Lipoprotein n=1 Tax=Virgibacillus kekensis TaxID=202261 RepID=A0ABV9DGU1_9BACI
MKKVFAVVTVLSIAFFGCLTSFELPSEPLMLVDPGLGDVDAPMKDYV